MVKKLEIDALFFLIVGSFFGVFLVAYVKTQPVQFHTNAAISLHTTQPTTAPTPTITFEPTTTNDSQISSDGSKKVVLKTIHNQDLSKTYEVSTGDNGPIIFTKTLDASENITLPFNAWEPQNRYFFIQEMTSEAPRVLVFNADGSPFGDGKPYLDLTDAYAKLGSSYNFNTATGWAGYNLIVINTKAGDGSQGASYWFEVPYGGILPLATKF